MLHNKVMSMIGARMDQIEGKRHIVAEIGIPNSIAHLCII